MTEVDLNPSAVADHGSPTGIESDAQEIVEAVADVVLRLGVAAIATNLAGERFRSNVFDLHGGVIYLFRPSALPESMGRGLQRTQAGKSDAFKMGFRSASWSCSIRRSPASG